MRFWNAELLLTFLSMHCGGCKQDQLLAFSCNRCGFCPSCGAKRTSETAAYLVDHVIPAVPVRQWVLSLPIVAAYCRCLLSLPIIAAYCTARIAGCTTQFGDHSVAGRSAQGHAALVTASQVKPNRSEASGVKNQPNHSIIQPKYSGCEGGCLECELAEIDADFQRYFCASKAHWPKETSK
jgi:Transposase zinc-binding domain